MFRNLAVGINLFHIILYYTISKSRSILIFYNRCNVGHQTFFDVWPKKRPHSRNSLVPFYSVQFFQRHMCPLKLIIAESQTQKRCLTCIHHQCRHPGNSVRGSLFLGCSRRSLANALPPIATSRNYPKAQHRYQLRTIYH